MEPIESLLDKYWKGETSLEEEQVIKNYFRNGSGDFETSPYFKGIAKKGEMKYKGSVPGFKATFTKRWYSLAATIVIGVLVGAISLQQNKSADPYLVDDPQKAFEITKNAFQMISNNLNEGKRYSKEINKINKSEQILRDKNN